MIVFALTFAASNYLIASDWSKYAEANTCVVDWSGMASVSYFDAARMNTKLVGNQMVKFVEALGAKGVKIGLINVAGHSLGAHAAAFFGKELGGLVNTIFGEF